jgi:GTPase SAR1 family protein
LPTRPAPKAQAFVLVYSITDEHSFLEVKNLWEQIKKVRPNILDVPCVIVGNNLDEENDRQRNLTFKGKTLIVKNFLLAQMGFETEMRGIPEKYKKEVNDLIWKFLWDNKPISGFPNLSAAFHFIYKFFSNVISVYIVPVKNT